MSPIDPVFIHDPDARLDYGWDWTAWLAPDDTIESVEILADVPLDLTGTTHDDHTVTVWVEAPPSPVPVGVTCRITTAEGRTEDRTIWLSIRDR